MTYVGPAAESLSRIDDILDMQRTQSRRISENEISLMTEAYKDMYDATLHQEWGYVLNIGAAFFQIAAAAYPETDPYGKTLKGISALISGAGGAITKWDEAKISKFQGKLEIVRNELQRTQGNESELVQKLNKMEEMLMAAIRALEEQRGTPFKKG